jgi:hypothetical protein
MENGGDNEHRPWYFDTPGTTDCTDNYRQFVSAHTELSTHSAVLTSPRCDVALCVES